MAQPSKSAPGRPPDKGSFPLDHKAECKAAMEAYMKCMRESGMESLKCRREVAAYLTCRMDHNLMAKEELDDLGLRKLDSASAAVTAAAETRTPQQRGFVAGLERVQAVRSHSADAAPPPPGPQPQR